jgi:hypothetical protein
MRPATPTSEWQADAMLNARRDHHDENPTNRSEHQGDHLGATRAFYGEILGLEVAMDLGFIETFISPNDPTVQISFIREDPSGLDPQLTVEVADIDELPFTCPDARSRYRVFADRRTVGRATVLCQGSEWDHHQCDVA